MTFIDPLNDTPIALLEYETGDAHIGKMRDKFRYLNTFLKHTPTVRIVAFFLTVTGVQHSWEEETDEGRESFAADEIPQLIAKFYRYPHNQSCPFLVGTFYKKHLEVRHFIRQGIRQTWKAHYASQSGSRAV